MTIAAQRPAVPADRQKYGKGRSWCVSGWDLTEPDLPDQRTRSTPISAMRAKKRTISLGSRMVFFYLPDIVHVLYM
jgi:hypothetical protein